MISRGFTPFPEIMTERLKLRKMTDADAPGLFAYQSNADNFKNVDMLVLRDVEGATAHIAKLNEGVDSDKWMNWAIADGLTDEIMGTICIWNLSEDNGEDAAELGYGLFPEFRGKGFMTEAVAAVERFGFEKMHLKSLDAYTHVNNAKSNRLLEKCLYVPVGQCTDEVTLSGEPMEMVIYRKKGLGRPRSILKPSRKR